VESAVQLLKNSAIAGSPAKKILIPLSQENLEIVGLAQLPLPKLVQELIVTRFKKG